MHRIISLLLFALMVFAGTGNGVASDWPAYGYDAMHHSNQPDPGNLKADTVATLHKDWDFFVPGAAFRASPTVFKEVVFIGSTHGVFYAIHASGPSKGTLKWRYPPLAVAGPDNCGIAGQLLRLPAGQSNTTSGPGIASSAAIVKGIPGIDYAVIFGAPDPTSNNGDGRMWALEIETGKCIWKSPVIAPATGTPKIGYSSPAVSKGRAFIGISARKPDATLTVGKLFAINIADGSIDPNFNFNAANPPSGGGIWGSPAIAPTNGNPIIVTGNSCHHFVPPPVACPNAPIVPDYTNSLIELDATSGNVLWQIQPVHIDWDNDPDWAVPPIVAKTTCGEMAMTVQKDGYLHMAKIRGGVYSDPACSYPDHDLACPVWSFPNAPNLPFKEDGHGDTPFSRPGALDGNKLYINPGGYNLTEMPPSNISGNMPAGRIRFDRLYSFDVCAQSGDRIRWIFQSPSGNFGGVSTANGLIYVGSNTGHLYVLGDPDVVPPPSKVCSYPNLPNAMCNAANFNLVYKPALLKDVTQVGDIRGIPAIVDGQVIVANTSGHVYGLIP